MKSKIPIRGSISSMWATIAIALALLTGAMGWANGALYAERYTVQLENASMRAEVVTLAKRVGQCRRW